MTDLINIIAPSAFLKRGLEILGSDEVAQQRVNRSTNVRRYKRHYGGPPSAHAALWEMLVTTDIENALLPRANAKDLDHFLLSLFYLKVYPTEEVLALRFGVHEQTARKWARFYIERLAALKQVKIQWPESWDSVFIISVDCVNFGINEPRHPTLHKDKAYFDRKGGKAGVTYEIALNLWQSNIVWLNGPFPPNSGGDRDIFISQGLIDVIPDGKKAIADKIYTGLAKIALHNSLDTEEVREFKRRARARQESINARLKSFNILRNRFRHGLTKHQQVVHAVAVLVCFNIENGSPLFNV